jgi:hypothetical protein
MSPPASFISNLIRQHPVLLSYTAMTTIAALRKYGSALKRALLDGLRGLLELQGGLCDFLAGCHANWWRLKVRFAENRRPPEHVGGEPVRVLPHRVEGD